MAQGEIRRINTGLTGFSLLGEIGEPEPDRIDGRCLFSSAPLYLGLEALAQLGAFHVRYLIDFEKHAFPVKINRCIFPPRRVLEGPYRLQARLTGRSAGAFSYELEAFQDGKLEIAGNFLYAAIDYDGRFSREKLQDHYRRAFACLRKGMRKNSSSRKRPDCFAGPKR